ncbi:hypothetical protein [Nocardia sp. NPDC052112]|uniref:hypothetical protein n=1 Tax=Nocardia sp. NPDC052112 TaxID=3155646 RepID=UPI00343BDF09
MLGTTRTAELTITVGADQDDAFSSELLHRLARLARERGIERFVAELIPRISG